MQKFIDQFFKNEHTFGAELLRYGFGVLFVLVAVKKFRMGYPGFAESLVSGDGHLANEIPALFLQIYGLALPAAEFVAGVALLTNKYVKEAYFGIAVMYLTFIFGQMYDGNTAKIGTEYFPAMLALIAAVYFRHKAHIK